MFRLFREPEKGEVCVIGADPSEGGDDCAAVAKSKKHADSFMVFSGKTDSAQFGYELLKMATFIKDKADFLPWIAVERNTGAATINVLVENNYKNLFRMPKFDSDSKSDEYSDKIGWHTNTATRTKMLDEYALALKQHATRVYDSITVDQLFSFIRNARTGKPEGAADTNDDLVIAEAIAWQVYKFTPKSKEVSWSQKISQFPTQQLFDDTGVPNV